MFVEHLEIKAAFKDRYYRADPELLMQVSFILYLSQHRFDPGVQSLRFPASPVWRLACSFSQEFGATQTLPQLALVW